MLNMDKTVKFKKITYPSVRKNAYLVSEYGDIYSLLSNKYLKPHEDKDGYCRVNLSGYISASVARIVAYQFCKNRDISLVVDHIDGNKKNNYYKNLEWVTIRENTRRAEKMGLRKVQGSHNGNSRYTDEFVHKVCKLLSEGLTAMEAFRRITNKKYCNMEDKNDSALYRFIHKLKSKKGWDYITSQYEYETSTRRHKNIVKPGKGNIFSEKEIHFICAMIKKNISPKDILDKMGITPENNLNYKNILGSIYEIRSGKSWRHISEKYGILKNVYSKIRKRYNIDNEKVYELVLKGMNTDDIMNELGMDPKNSAYRLFRKAINRRVAVFKKIISMDEEESIHIKLTSIPRNLITLGVTS